MTNEIKNRTVDTVFSRIEQLKLLFELLDWNEEQFVFSDNKSTIETDIGTVLNEMKEGVRAKVEANK